MTTEMPNRDGSSFVAAIDKERLDTQHQKILAVVIKGEWVTLNEIKKLFGIDHQSGSARLRDFRKDKFGGYAVTEERVGDRGLWRYRVRFGVTRVKIITDEDGNVEEVRGHHGQLIPFKVRRRKM